MALVGQVLKAHAVVAIQRALELQCEHQIQVSPPEVRASLLIQHHDLAIQERPLAFQTAQNLLKKVALRSA